MDGRERDPVVGGGNTHHPGAAAEEPEFRSVDFTLTIDKQEGRRLSGIFSSPRGSYRVVAVVSRTGTIFLADVRGLFQRDYASVRSHGALLS